MVYIHPEAERIDGHPSQPSLQAVNGQVECVLLSVPAEQGKMVLRDAATAGLSKAWLQQGADDSPE